MRYHWIGLGGVAALIVAIWYSHAEEQRATATRDDAALTKHGEYLVNNVAHCGHCHTPPNDKGEPDTARFLQGGKLTIKPKDEKTSWAGEAPDITMNGLASRWTAEGMTKFLMTGEPPEGHKPVAPMPVYRLNNDDARAVTLYLRSLTGKKAPKPD